MSPQLSSAPPLAKPRGGGRGLVLAWLVSRLLMIGLLAAAERVTLGDPTYYWHKIGALFDVGLGQTLNEYPTPVTWLLTVPYLLGGGTRWGYRIAFMALMVALDGLFGWLLWRLNGRRRDASTDFWIAFVFLIGPLTYLRFDLVPAVLAGAALLMIMRRPALAGVLTGIGAAVKLWPALLIGVLAAGRGVRRRALTGFLLAGAALALLSLVFGGLRRLVSPLTWQSDRGLQIESLWATPLMVLRALRPDVWRVDISSYQAYEIFGPSVGAFLLASTIATVLGLVVIVAVIARAFRNGSPSPTAVGLGMMAIIAVMTVTNKTLSPQYLLWLGGPMAALLLLDRRQQLGRQEGGHQEGSQQEVGRREPGPKEVGRPDLIRRLAFQLLLLALLTQLVYPLLYSGLQGLHGRFLEGLATVVLLLRNLALAIFTVAVCASAWRALAPGRTSDGPDR